MTDTQQTWQRARRPEQKLQRREAILNATAVLLDEEGVAGTGLNAIARRAGIAKANIYRYFESREAALLELLRQEQDLWLSEFSSKMEKLEGTRDLTGVASAFADTLDNRPRLCVLVAALASVLEHNVGADGIASFKREMTEKLRPVLDRLCRVIPGMQQDSARRFVMQQVMAAAGFWSHTHPTQTVQSVLEQPEFQGYRFDFKDLIRSNALAHLMLASNEAMQQEARTNATARTFETEA